MGRELSLFAGTFTTLLAIINPLEVLPVYLQLLVGKDDATRRAVAWKACLYSLLLCLFFLVFGTFILRLFGVPLAMVRVVGGIILMRIGFSLFMPQKSGADFGLSGAGEANIAFVPLAMPLMCGPGAIATIIGMTATIRRSSTEVLSFIARPTPGSSGVFQPDTSTPVKPSWSSTNDFKPTHPSFERPLNRL